MCEVDAAACGNMCDSRILSVDVRDFDPKKKSHNGGFKTLSIHFDDSTYSPKCFVCLVSKNYSNSEVGVTQIYAESDRARAVAATKEMF